MRRKLAGLGIAALLSALGALGVFGFGGKAVLADGCNYRGGENALPTNSVPGLPVVGAPPVLVYGNATTAPSGFVGVSQGSALLYAQAEGDASGAQVEASSATAGESLWVNSDGAYGSCG
jgi:hypothetical protein